jgi:hypothetical protein
VLLLLLHQMPIHQWPGLQPCLNNVTIHIQLTDTRMNMPCFRYGLCFLGWLWQACNQPARSCPFVFPGHFSSRYC